MVELYMRVAPTITIIEVAAVAFALYETLRQRL